MADIVGWLAHRDHICAWCKAAPAEVIIEDKHFYDVEVCRSCAGEGRDFVQEVFDKLP